MSVDNQSNSILDSFVELGFTEENARKLQASGYTVEDVEDILDSNYLSAVLSGLWQEAQWETLSDEGQYNFLKRCIYANAKDRNYNPHEMFGTELEEYVASAWGFMTERFRNFDSLLKDEQRRQFEKKEPRTINSLVYNSAKAVIEQEHRRSKKLKENEVETVRKNENNEDVDLFQNVPSAANTENSVVLRDAIKSILENCDDKDRKIIVLLQAGLTMDEIGTKIGVSKSAVSQRVKKIRKKFIDAGLHE